MIHRCHWNDCEAEVEPAKLFCRHHWFKLPGYLRKAILANYRRGQEIDKSPSPGYMAVIKEVKKFIDDYDKPQGEQNV